MSYITFEDFLKHTNVMEVVIAKMKEEGPRIFRINYPKREKYCRFLYDNFMDPKLRNKVFRFGLTLKAMPNSFKEKFLRFPEPNEMTDIRNLSSSPDQQNTKSNSPRLEDKYKDDQPSTSQAYIHKLRKSTSTKENPKQKKCKQESNSKQKPSSSTKCSSKITNYFSSNSQNCKDHDRLDSQAGVEGKKRKSSECKEVEPQAKRSKEAPIINKESENEKKSLQTKIKPLNSDSKSKNKISPNKHESNSKSAKKLDFDNPVSNFKKENSNSQTNKTKTQSKPEAEDLVSDDDDIISEYTIIDLSTQESIHDPQAENPNMGDENSLSPSKLTLPKRNRTEDYLVSSFASSKNNFDEFSLGNRTECITRMSRNDIFIWRDQGIKATEEHNNDNAEDGCFSELEREDVSVRFNLQLARAEPDKMKKYIKHLIKRRKLKKSINLEPPVAYGSRLRTKMLQAFSQMTFEDFKHLVNAQKYISHWTAQGKPLDEAEQIFKTYYATERQNAWPDVHIDLNRLQKYLLSKGFKGSLLLHFIPPRYLSFDEVLEKTNIKEFISLSCLKPPESYSQLLSLCKGEYEKCCWQGVWTEGLKFNEDKEENTSTQDMSIELFSQSTDLDSQQVQVNVSLQNEEATQLHEVHSTESFAKKKKIQKCGPKSRKKQLSLSDELENQMNLLLGTDEQPASKNVVSMEKIDTQVLYQILVQSQLQECQNDNTNLSVGSKNTEKEAITSSTNESDCNSKSQTCANTVTEQLLSKISSDIDDAVPKSSYNQNSDSIEKTPPSELIASRLDYQPSQSVVTEVPIAKSPNLFQSSGESITKDIESQQIEVQTQESVYVACENNNDCNYTEQNNFSIRTIEASDSEDPFAEVVVSEENTIENASLVQATTSDDSSKLTQTDVILTAEDVEGVLPTMESKVDSTLLLDTATNTMESKENSSTAKNTENVGSAESSHVVEHFVPPPTDEHTSLVTPNQITNEEKTESAATQPVVRDPHKESDELDKVSSHENENPPCEDQITENQNVSEKNENEVEHCISPDSNNKSITDAERSANEMNSSMSSAKNLKVVVKRAGV